MADPIDRLRTFLKENTDKKGTPLYETSYGQANGAKNSFLWRFVPLLRNSVLEAIEPVD